MGTAKLGKPPKIVSNGPLPIVVANPSCLYRISLHTSGEPYFGCSGSNRFDAPGSSAVPPTPEYKCCYFGQSLNVAIAETILHDLVPLNGAFRIAHASLDLFHVIRFRGKELQLADLTGPALKKLNGNADLAGHDMYNVTQQWALAVFKNPAAVDGFIYMSRHLNTEKAVVLFDRAQSKIRKRSAEKLVRARGFKAAAILFDIVAV